MNCLPGSHPCEHIVTNALVQDRNHLKGANFEHRSCPDKIERNRPEPDALYVDVATGQVMVVEHKSLVWPPEYAARHRNDHMLMDKVLSLFGSEVVNGRFELELPFLLDASKQEITELAQSIADSSDEHRHELARGGVVSGVWSGRKWRLRPLESDEVTGQQGGMVFSWDLRESRTNTNVEPPVLALVDQLLEATTKKFAQYTAAKCVVLLELTGLTPILAGRCLMKGVTPPCRVDEIWTGFYDYFDDGTEGWLFEEVWSKEPARGCG